MRKLIMKMSISVDGFVSGAKDPKGITSPRRRYFS